MSNIAFNAVKYFVCAFNLFSLILGICVVSLSVVGVQCSEANSEEHTYYIVGIILGSFICMATTFGCYGVANESLGVNTIYAFFMLMLLVVQILQMQVYRQRMFYANALENLESAWNARNTKPHQMSSIERRYQCCGLYNSNDYDFHNLSIAASCYKNNDVSQMSDLYTTGCLNAIQAAYQQNMQRESYFNWALLIAECAVFIYSSILSILLCRKYKQQQQYEQIVPGYVEETPQNHINRYQHF